MPILNRIRTSLLRTSDLLAQRWKQNFYFYLAVLFTLFAIADAAYLHLATDLRQTTFDMMVRYRMVVPKPDSDIVIIEPLQNPVIARSAATKQSVSS